MANLMQVAKKLVGILQDIKNVLLGGVHTFKHVHAFCMTDYRKIAKTCCKEHNLTALCKGGKKCMRGKVPVKG